MNLFVSELYRDAYDDGYNDNPPSIVFLESSVEDRDTYNSGYAAGRLDKIRGRPNKNEE